MSSRTTESSLKKATLAGLIITLGIVYGDIGTSPLYVMKAIFSGLHAPVATDIYGALSCIIWTLTLQTTVKYVIITLRADNKGEGGIFALFALIRRQAPWVYIFAIIGGSTLLADGIITPSITVTSAVEGVNLVNSSLPVVPVVILILTVLFFIQQFGTSVIGKSFGPIMMLWFIMLGSLGLVQIVQHPAVLQSFNPLYAVHFVTSVRGGFILLGAVFLATTGAEALYSDLGHVGLKNIRISWVLVKTMLILNYLGQGAWIISFHGARLPNNNPFFGIMPDWFLMPGIAVATAAAIIASQAMISGSYTLISEAISLNFWPRQRLVYPTNIKGQVYVPAINWFLLISCLFVVVFFRESSKMEAAYGLSITITMLMTTMLMYNFLTIRNVHLVWRLLFAGVFLSIEGSFLIANLHKFAHGGWFTILIGTLFSLIMYFWYNGRKVKNKFLRFININQFIPVLNDISNDTSIPKFATHLVYVTKANVSDEMESKIIYSIVNKQPKRADVYWFLHVDILDQPNTFEYEVTHFIPGKVIKVDFRLGFKVQPKINLYFKQVLEDLKKSGEVNVASRYLSLQRHNIEGDFRFIVIDRVTTYDYEYSIYQKVVLTMYEYIRKMGISESHSLGLDTSNLTIEKVPLSIPDEHGRKIVRMR